MYAAESYTRRPATTIADLALPLRTAADAVAREGTHVRYVRSLLLPNDEICFHLFEADSPAAVGRVSTRAGLRYERILEAVE